MHTAFSSRGLHVTYGKARALCIAQMAFCGVALPLVERAVTFFSRNPSCPFHICWQKTIFFSSYVLSRGTRNERRLNFNSSRRNLTPKGGVMLQKVLVAFCRSFGMCDTQVWKDKAMPKKASIFRCFYEPEHGTVDVNDFLAVFSLPAKQQG